LKTVAVPVPVSAIALLLTGALCMMTAAAATPGSTARDGRGDFDFLVGTLHTHYKLLRHRLSNDHEWYDCEDTSTIHRFWDGSGSLEDGDLRCPSTKRYVHGMALRLYDVVAHHWTIYWGTTKLGLTMPPVVGGFDENGVGQFFAHDKWENKPILVRFKWTQTKSAHPHFEQAFSVDDGRTWEPNWTTDYTRVTPPSR